MIWSVLQHKCQSRATRMRHERHECNTSDTSATQVLHERHQCYTNDASATRAENFNLDNNTSENIFSHPLLAIWQMKDCKDSKNFILRTTFLKCLVPIPKCI